MTGLLEHLTDDEMALMRRDAEAQLYQHATIRRRSSPGGGAFSTVASDVPCRLDPVGQGGAGKVGLPQAAADVDANAVLAVPVGTDLRNRDRVIVEGRAFDVGYVAFAPISLQRAYGTVEG